MPLTEWNEQAQSQIVAKYPELEGKSEGILFCAAALEDEPELKLVDMREKGRLFAPELSFSPVSITSAQIAMGRREKKPRKPRGAKKRATGAETAEAPSTLGAGSPFGSGTGRLAKIERKLGNALSVLEQFETARRSYVQMKGRIEQLNPSVLSLLAELDDGAREILEKEGLISPLTGDESAETGEREAGGLY